MKAVKALPTSGLWRLLLWPPIAVLSLAGLSPSYIKENDITSHQQLVWSQNTIPLPWPLCFSWLSVVPGTGRH